MSISASSWRCENCQRLFKYAGEPHLATCPSCASVYLTRFVNLEDTATLKIYEHTSILAKDPSLSSANKRRRELRTGTRTERSGSGRMVTEVREIDHDSGRYRERIVDARTGEVLRDIEEPLAQHRGGSEKKRD